ncbi:hypothetical protein [Zoogloea sp.]|uniref:hypothetical protein n=1 Tax=Zoogloea sp. TaxID=49181 RepID=UPI0014163B63|nr:MAG: hypothetical protein F9K15_11875 [Zoogloea sp.]
MPGLLTLLFTLALAGVLAYVYWLGKTSRGIDGILALLVMALFVALPTYRMVAVGWLQEEATRHPEVSASPFWDLEYTAAMIVTAASLGGSIFGGVRLLSGLGRSALHQAIAALWVAGPLAHVILLLITSQVADMGAENKPSLLINIATASALAIGASLYLLCSKRVRALYNNEIPAAEPEAEA